VIKGFCWMIFDWLEEYDIWNRDMTASLEHEILFWSWT